MSTVVEELKKKINDAGGNSAGVKTVSEAVKRLDVGGGESTNSGVLSLSTTVEVIDDYTTKYVLSETAETIYSAVQDGKIVTNTQTFVDAGLTVWVKVWLLDFFSFDENCVQFTCDEDSVTYFFDSITDYPAWIDDHK